MAVDRNGRRENPQPLVLAAGANTVSIASDGQQYLAAWERSDAVWVAYIPLGARQTLGAPFRVADNAKSPSVAFDGTRFVLAWRRKSDGAIAAAPMTAFGAFPVMTASVAADPTQPLTISADERTAPILAFAQSSDSVATRAAVLSLTDLAPAAVPPAPVEVAASLGNGDQFETRWKRVDGALGFAIELRLLDGSYQTIGVAPGAATSAVVSTGGFRGTAIRVRAWNATGVSEPSADVPMVSHGRAVRER